MDIREAAVLRLPYLTFGQLLCDGLYILKSYHNQISQ